MVANKDMKMPKSCYACREQAHCYWAIGNGWIQDKRDDDCPLVEIGTCKDCKHLGVMDCGYYCKLNHRGKISKESNYGGMGDFYCADFERRE